MSESSLFSLNMTSFDSTLSLNRRFSFVFLIFKFDAQNFFFNVSFCLIHNFQQTIISDKKGRETITEFFLFIGGRGLGQFSDFN